MNFGTMMTATVLGVIAGQAMGQGECGFVKFHHPDPASGDRFGAGVSVGGNVMVIGAPADDTAPGVDGGTRFIYEKINGAWQLRTYSQDLGNSNFYGRCVATDGLIVASGEGSGPSNGSWVRGAGYIGTKVGNSWTSAAMPNVGLIAGDEFGWSVAVGHGRVAFGAPRRDFNANDDMGAVFVFRINAQNQSELVTEIKRPAFSTQAAEHFGYSVAIAPTGGPNAGMLVVGSPDRDSEFATSTGGIYVFNATGQGYQLQNLPTQWDEDFQFNGLSVATNGNWIVSGAPSFGNARGRVFLYQKLQNGNWEVSGFISGPDGDGGNFGTAISMTNGWMTVTAPGLDKVYVFREDGGSWVQQRVISRTFTNGSTAWGSAVAIDGTDLFVGDSNDTYGEVTTAGTVSRIGLDQMAGGDHAGGAEWIPVPTSLVSCLNNATPTPQGLPGMCGTSSSAADVFFKFNPRFTGAVVVDTFGSDFDTVLSAHSQEPTWQDAHTLICNDDFNGSQNRQSRIAFNVTRGEEYWLRVAGYQGAVGTFHLNVRQDCAADFNEDGFVDFFDYDDFVNCFENAVCPTGRTADITGDDFVDFFDYDAFVQIFEQGCSF